MGLHRWQTCTIKVERNPQDTRAESWKLVGSKQWELLEVDGIGSKVPSEQRLAIIDACAASCPQDLNDERKSLAVIKAPDIINCTFAVNPTKPPRQNHLIPYALEAFASTKADYPFVPKLSYRCIHGHEHDATVIEWGAYEWMRKNPANIDGYWENIRIQDGTWVKHLLIGNQCNARNSWIIVGILTLRQEANVGNVAEAWQMNLPLHV